MAKAAMTAQATAHVTQQQAVEWFKSLKDHPERYRFATHDGFTFTNGDFGTPGAQFETRERFYGLHLTLRFELTGIEPARFRFRLRHLPVWGAFTLEQTSTISNETIVHLDVGGNTTLGEMIVRCPIVRGAIKRQIQGEVNNITASMESLNGSLSRKPNERN